MPTYLYPQLDIAIEEMSELIQAICKQKRGKCNLDNILEEIVDVEIMLEQLKMIYDCVENLEWVTHQENSIHGVRHGNAFRNSKKLNWAQINLIREMYEWSEKNAEHRLVKPFTHKWLAKCFKVSPSAIGWAVNRKTWTGER